MTQGTDWLPAAADQQRNRSPQRQLLWLLPVLALALVVAGVAAWIHLASSYRSALTVTLAQPVSCTGANVSHRLIGFDRPAIDVVNVRPGMLCDVVVRFTNTAPVSVQLGAATFDLLGPSTGGTMSLFGSGQDLSAKIHLLGGKTLGPMDATFHLDRTLGAGQSFDVTYHLKFHTHGCNDNTVWETGMPRVSVKALWLTGDVHGTVGLAWHGPVGHCTAR